MKCSIVLMAGLPGTGKSTLARQLASELNGIVLNKDAIRAGLFPEELIEYSQVQDDFCMKILFQVAEYLIRARDLRLLFVDGRPFARNYQIDAAADFVSRIGCRLKIIHTICSDETARDRIDRDIKAGLHPARNRTLSLYTSLRDSFEEITQPRLLVNTEGPLSECIARCRAYLAGAVP